MKEAKIEEISWSKAIKISSPHPYALATTIDKNGKPNAIGLGWWTLTSWEPPMLAISIGKARYSYECIEYCKEFVLCLPTEELKEFAWTCGTKSGRNCDKFKEANIKTIPAKKVKPPIVDGSLVAFECKVVNKVETGDHVLYIGEIVAIHGLAEAKKHLYSIGYTRLVSLDINGNTNFNL